MAMSTSKKSFLDVLYVYQNTDDTISVQTRDQHNYSLGGNASKYLSVTPPFRRTEDGNLSVPKGYVQLCNTVTFRFTDGPLEGKESSCSLVDGHKLTSNPADPQSSASYSEALRYFAATHGGETSQRLHIPSPSSLDFYEYEVERRQVSIQSKDLAEFPTFEVSIEVFCRTVGPE
jgi:hypothetical protein